MQGIKEQEKPVQSVSGEIEAWEEKVEAMKKLQGSDEWKATLFLLAITLEVPQYTTVIASQGPLQ